MRRPGLLCRIYDNEGFGRPPIREFTGSEYKEEPGIGPRFRRWGGGVLFFGGLILTIIDWRSDFELSWPAKIGTRPLFPGLALQVTDVVIVLAERRKRLRRRGNFRIPFGQIYQRFVAIKTGGCGVTVQGLAVVTVA